MNRFTKAMLTGALALLVVAAACGGSTGSTASDHAVRTPRPVANQAPSQVAAPLDLTFGFRVYNSTGHDVKFVRSTNSDPMSGPPDGSILHSDGTYLDFELTYKVFTYTWRDLFFAVEDANGAQIAQVVVTIYVNGGITGPSPGLEKDNIQTTALWDPSLVPQGESTNSWSTIRLNPKSAPPVAP